MSDSSAVDLGDGYTQVTAEWPNTSGDCDDCSWPAGFAVWAHGPDQPPGRYCCACTASHAAAAAVPVRVTHLDDTTTAEVTR